MAAFQTSLDRGIRILAISGRLDLQSGSDLRDTLRSLTEEEDPVDLWWT
jgi:hypothetical protein